MCMQAHRCEGRSSTTASGYDLVWVSDLNAPIKAQGCRFTEKNGLGSTQAVLLKELGGISVDDDE